MQINEWTIFIVIGEIVVFGIAVIKPIITLTNSITRLTTVVDKLEKSAETRDAKNSDSHRRLWEHNKAQDDVLDDHEKRITIMERE